MWLFTLSLIAEVVGVNVGLILQLVRAELVAVAERGEEPEREGHGDGEVGEQEAEDDAHAGPHGDVDGANVGV